MTCGVGVLDEYGITTGISVVFVGVGFGVKVAASLAWVGAGWAVSVTDAAAGGTSVIVGGNTCAGDAAQADSIGDKTTSRIEKADFICLLLSGWEKDGGRY
jgi:hypothetical protein